MKIRMLGSSTRDVAHRQYVSSYLVDEHVAIDAGCLGYHGTPQEQEAIRHVFLTHSHADHTSSLPVMTENAYTASSNCPVIYGSPETLDAVQKHIFNDVIWPDFIFLSKRMPAFLRMQPLEPEVAIEVEGYRITPVCVNHVVPTFGYIVDDGGGSVIFGGDSGPTERLWQIARDLPKLRAVFLEATFPNAMEGLATVSAHLTPAMFAQEAAKIERKVRLMAVHIKTRYRETIIAELTALGLPVEIVECEREYDF